MRAYARVDGSGGGEQNSVERRGGDGRVNNKTESFSSLHRQRPGPHLYVCFQRTKKLKLKSEFLNPLWKRKTRPRSLQTRHATPLPTSPTLPLNVEQTNKTTRPACLLALLELLISVVFALGPILTYTTATNSNYTNAGHHASLPPSPALREQRKKQGKRKEKENGKRKQSPHTE